MPEANREDVIVLEVFGEGITDFGEGTVTAIHPDQGVVPILVYRLCGKPTTMRVKAKRFAHLQGRKLWQKVCFAKRQANYNNGTRGAVFVLDTEGDDKVVRTMAQGRDHELPDFPMAIGAARPCIEAWLLADPSAIRELPGRSRATEAVDSPESLPAPRVNRQHNPKTVLAALGADSKAQKDTIANKLDLSAARQRCSLSFEPFAAEVETLLQPLFA